MFRGGCQTESMPRALYNVGFPMLIPILIYYFRGTSYNEGNNRESAAPLTLGARGKFWFEPLLVWVGFILLRGLYYCLQ